jgi:hypothetical protein
MFFYKPKKFASIYASELGQQFWTFLTLPENIARLETASDLSKHAVEGIEEQLLEAFRVDVLADRVKQMIGDMMRQILEQRGWVLDQGDVKVQSVPFMKAARYRRRHWFTFHAFRNTSDPRYVAITDRRQNAPLPVGVSWSYDATFTSHIKAAVAIGVRDISQLRQQVHTNGYQRIRVERMLRGA